MTDNTEHNIHYDQVVMRSDWYQYRKVVDICDKCACRKNDIVDGEVPCQEWICPFFAIAVKWLQIRDAKTIDDHKEVVKYD